MPTPKLIPFVGRQSELDTVMQRLERWGQTCAIVIDGEGGVGKSRLLEEIFSKCTSDPRIYALPIKDLTDPRLKVGARIELAIADDIGMSHFASYQQALADLAHVQESQVSHQTIEQELGRTFTQFVECYNAFADNKRVSLLFDTLDAIEGTPAWDYLTNLLIQFKNTLFIFTGRNAALFYEVALKQLGPDNSQMLHLGPFNIEDARSFFAAELSYRRIKLPDEVRDRIILLSSGKAILIDLAVERVARTNSQQWMNQQSHEIFEALPETVKVQVRQDFEHDVVQYFANLGTYEEQLKLFMAHVSWVDDSLAARLLRIDESEAQRLISSMCSLTHIKEFPGGLINPGPRISLHDEFAHLIRNYVYKDIDEDSTLRQEKSAIAAEYLGEQARAIKERVDNIQLKLNAARQTNNAVMEMQHTVEKEEHLQEYWKIAQERLYHSLNAQPAVGAKLFLDLFDEATRQYRLRERDAVVQQIMPHFRETYLPTEIYYDVGIRLAQHQLDHGETQSAKKRLDELLECCSSDFVQSIEIHRLLGNTLVRLGEVAQGIKSFERAVVLSEQYNDLGLRAGAENALGWANRLVSCWKDACVHYRRALVISQELNDLSLQASILNNLGFAYSFFNRREGINLSSRALEIWTQLDDQRGVGAANSTLGNLYYQMNEPHKALGYFDRALAIFEPRRDREFIARVYAWLGVTHFVLHDLDKAEECLRLSLQQDVKETTAQALNRLARVYRERGDLDMAEKLLLESYETSRQICDVVYELASLRDLISLAVKKQEYHRYSDFVKLVNRFDDYWRDAPDPHTHGGTYLYLAFLVLGQQRRDVTYPKILLGQAFEHIAKHGFYANLEPKTYFDEADRFLRYKIRPEVVQDIGSHLWNYFRNQEDPAFDLALDYFNRWRRIGAK